MENLQEQEIQELFETHENNFCFECDAQSSQSVSMNNGIFLCVACAGIHRGFGLDVSFVRSLTIDTWSQIEFNMIKKGGNGKLKEFFEQYGITMGGPMDVKYQTKMSQYYRERLLAEAENKPLPSDPLPDEILQMQLEKQEAKSYLSQEESHEDTVLDEVLDTSDSHQTNETIQKTKNGAKITKAFKSFGTSISKGAKSVATGTKSVTTKLNEKMKNSHIKENTKVLRNKVTTGVKGAAGKIAGAAKKGYVGVVGYFKNLSMKKKVRNSERDIEYETTDITNYQEQIQSQEEAYDLDEDLRPCASL